MAEVGSRDLRNRTRALLARVEAGERITITVQGRPVARLEPVGRRARWLSRPAFVAALGGRQADPGLAADLTALGDETTDDLPLR